MSDERIKARIMTVMRNLPPLPAVTRQLLAVIKDDDSSADDVTKVLSGDGTLAGKVLKLVNSSFYGVPSEVTTISRAVVILGFTGIRNLALGFGTVEALSGIKSGMDMTPLWSHAMATGAAAQALAPHVSRRTDPEEAFIAGLMHDIGAHVLAAAVPEVYQDVLQAPPGERLVLEAENFGFDHGKTGQALLKFWELPEEFGHAARYHHDYDRATGDEQPLTTLVAMADILACIHGGDFETNASEGDLSRLCAASGLKVETLMTALGAMDTKLEDMSSFMNISGTGAEAKNVARHESQKCVVVTTDDGRRDIVSGMLTHLGHTLFPMESYFNQEAGSNEVQMVLVDPQTLTKDQVERLAVFLDSQPSAHAVLVERDAPIPDCLTHWPKLTFLFSAKQLDEVRTKQPA